jgi:hypothetical protein
MMKIVVDCSDDDNNNSENWSAMDGSLHRIWVCLKADDLVPTYQWVHDTANSNPKLSSR